MADHRNVSLLVYRSWVRGGVWILWSRIRQGKRRCSRRCQKNVL